MDCDSQIWIGLGFNQIQLPIELRLYAFLLTFLLKYLVVYKVNGMDTRVIQTEIKTAIKEKTKTQSSREVFNEVLLSFHVLRFCTHLFNVGIRNRRYFLSQEWNLVHELHKYTAYWY